MEVQPQQEVFFSILKHVSFKERMQMRLVSKAFAADAWAATDALWLQHTNKSTARTWLNDWIDRHGRQLTSSRLEQQQYHWQLLSLPCPGLQSLQLGHIQVPLNLSRDGSSLQLLRATTGLTRLAFVNVAATDGSSDNLIALTALTALEQLEVDATGHGVDAAYLPQLLRLPSRLIPCLTQVTHLALHHAVTDLWALQQVSRLTALNSISIDATRAHSPTSAAVGFLLSAQDVLRALQPLHILTALCLAGSCRLDGENLQQLFSTLTDLRHLKLRNFRAVDPGLLAPLTDLQHLVLNYTGFEEGAAELLAWLAQLQGLTYLDLSGALTDKHPQAPAAAYSALTASSNLQHLDLTDCCLPEGKAVWQVVFAPHTRLPQLTFLQLSGGNVRPNSRSLRNMVLCCPALQQLRMSRMGYFKWELAAITGLSGLTSLTASVYQQRIAAGVLPALTALRAVNLKLPTRGLHRHTLLPLTQLRQLESLLVTAPGTQQPTLVLRNRAPEGLPPDVWHQLRDWAGAASSVANCVAVVHVAVTWAWGTLDWILPIVSLFYVCAYFLKAGDAPFPVFGVLFLLRAFANMYNGKGAQPRG